MAVIHDRDRVIIDYDRYRTRAQCLRREYTRELFTKGRAVAASSTGRLGVFAAAFGLATAVFWATMLTSPPVTEATTVRGITSAEIERAAPKDAPIQDARAIACTYVLTDGHDCH